MTIMEVCFMTKKIVVKLLTLLSWLFLVKIFHVLKLKKISYIFQLKFENQANLHYSIDEFLKQNLAITLRGRDVWLTGF